MSGTAPSHHASCVAYQGRGLVIFGPSGSGKSGLALQLMALGAALVADDRTRIWAEGGVLMAGAPPGLPALIEARGLGLLRVPALHGPVPLALAVDLGRSETDRLPPERRLDLAGLSLPLVFRSEGAHFPGAVLHLLSFGRGG